MFTKGFIEAFKNAAYTNEEWQPDYLPSDSGDGAIRYTQDKYSCSHCPITLVCEDLTGRQYTIAEYVKAAEAIDLDVQDAKAIVEAADGMSDCDMNLRDRLLAIARIGVKRHALRAEGARA